MQGGGNAAPGRLRAGVQQASEVAEEVISEDEVQVISADEVIDAATDGDVMQETIDIGEMMETGEVAQMEVATETQVEEAPKRRGRKPKDPNAAPTSGAKRRLGVTNPRQAPAEIVVKSGQTLNMSDFHEMIYQKLSTEEGAARFGLPVFNIKADIERFVNALFSLAFDAGKQGASAVTLSTYNGGEDTNNQVRHLTLRFTNSDGSRIFPNPRASEGKTHTRTRGRLRAEMKVRVLEGETDYGHFDGETFHLYQGD